MELKMEILLLLINMMNREKINLNHIKNISTIILIINFYVSQKK